MGGRKNPGFLGVPNVPEYVRSACDITWMSAHEKVGHGSTRTGVVVSVADRRKYIGFINLTNDIMHVNNIIVISELLCQRAS